jgi:hypothetical protein
LFNVGGEIVRIVEPARGDVYAARQNSQGCLAESAADASGSAGAWSS